MSHPLRHVRGSEIAHMLAHRDQNRAALREVVAGLDAAGLAMLMQEIDRRGVSARGLERAIAFGAAVGIGDIIAEIHAEATGGDGGGEEE